MKFLHLILLFFLTPILLSAQSIRPKDLVEKRQGQFAKFDLFTIDQTANRNNPFQDLSHYSILDVEFKKTDQLSDAIALTVPLSENDVLTLELVQVDIFSDDHLAIAEPSGEIIRVDEGRHYRGIIKGMPHSLVSMSIFNDEVSAIISHPKHAGNFVLGKLKSQKNLKKHIIYLDTDLSTDVLLSCSTTDEGEKYTKDELQDVSNSSRALSDCVRLLLEVDYNMHQELGSSTTASNNYINSLFNSIATIYAGENINTTLSASFVWTSSSPYSGSSASAMLSTYQSNRNNFNADFAQLLTFVNFGGIAATINGVCKTENSRMCVSGVVNDIATAPTYSFDVQIAAHEYGHLFGSFHTHGCYWNGNNTQIDDCGNTLVANNGQTPEGNACFNSSNPIYPNNGGTIMSYCYGISGVGINFSNGFGTQPGNAIRNRVANGSCLQACGGSGGCEENALTLEIRTDNYPGETTWSITNSGGSTVASGGAYGSANTTYTEDICLPDGCYTFTINDSYGDGICCSFGNGSYTLTASDGTVITSGGSFGSSESTNFCEGSGPPPSPCVEIDFDDYSVVAYGNGQDNGTFTKLTNGEGVAIFDNAWKSIALNYTITPNTKISFQFGSTQQGEIHGIGFDTDSGISSGRTFQLWGTQNWGNRDYDYTSPGNWQSFTIPVGQYYTGTFNRLFFVADHDGGAQNGNTYVRYIEIYEGASCGSSQAEAQEVVARNGYTAMVDGLPDEGGVSSLKLYPNPASLNVSLEHRSNVSGNAVLEIFDLLGQRISTRPLDLQQGENTLSISTHTLISGTYFLKLSTQEGEWVEKLTIAK